MTTRRIVFGLLVVIAVASGAIVAYMPPFTPAGTVEIRSLAPDSAGTTSG
jgi:hypothetical protein